jgi:UDP-N-acetylglucosamine 2-epimerase (non-hydrolysing)
LAKYCIKPARGDYHVLTLHRQENLEDGARLGAIIEGLVQTGRRIVFPAHPRTLQRLKDFGLIETLGKSRIELCKPMGYVDFIRLAAGADKILTDSGGVRREAYLLHKPCVVLINLSWFPEISQAGWKVLTGPDPARIAHLVNHFEPTGPYQELFGDGAAHRKIADGLASRYAD